MHLGDFNHGSLGHHCQAGDEAEHIIHKASLLVCVRACVWVRVCGHVPVGDGDIIPLCLFLSDAGPTACV